MHYVLRLSNHEAFHIHCTYTVAVRFWNPLISYWPPSLHPSFESFPASCKTHYHKENRPSIFSQTGIAFHKWGSLVIKWQCCYKLKITYLLRKEIIVNIRVWRFLVTYMLCSYSSLQTFNIYIRRQCLQLIHCICLAICYSFHLDLQDTNFLLLSHLWLPKS